MRAEISWVRSYFFSYGVNMSVLYTFRPQLDTIFVIWDGTVTGEDWYTYLSELFAEPGFPTLGHIILDARTVADISFVRDRDITFITAFLQAKTEILKNKKFAVLVNTKFDRAKKIQSALSHVGLSIIFFNSIDTACTFL